MARGSESAASTPGSRGPRSSRQRARWAAALLVASLLLFAARCWADSGEAPPAVTQKVPSAAELQNSFPLPYALRRFVNLSRAEARAIIRGEDDRLLVIVGPCSIHDPRAARDYARLLQEVREEVKDDLLIFMRTYLEKPRTSVGWRGLISDPALNGQEDLARGLALGRRVLLDMNALGLPSATEFLDPLVAPYLEDVVSYGSIGARTVESPVHRQLAAHLAMPIGFKNGRNGASLGTNGAFGSGAGKENPSATGGKLGGRTRVQPVGEP
ncbi:unnamed protein product [Effrenium voratum]|nr:unnamed protein product [Effrenium voratum]